MSQLYALKGNHIHDPPLVPQSEAAQHKLWEMPSALFPVHRALASSSYVHDSGVSNRTLHSILLCHSPCYPLCRGSLTAGSKNPPHVQERKCWEPGPKSRWASWSCFRRSFMEAWRMDRRIQRQPIRHFKLKLHSGRLVYGLRNALSRLSWHLHSPVHSVLYTSSHRLRQHRPHLHLICIRIFTVKVTAGINSPIRS